MTIMVYAVLIAVSAFFYAPMEVSAIENSFSGSSSFYTLADGSMLSEFSTGFSGNDAITSGPLYYRAFELTSDFFDLTDLSLESDSLYKVDFSVDLGLSFTKSLFTRNVYLSYGDLSLLYSVFPDGSINQVYEHQYTNDNIIYATGSQLKNNKLELKSVLLCSSSGNFSYAVTPQIILNSIDKVSSTDSQDYQNGYNAGYSAGESAGYGNGYSNGFADGEASVDTDAIYDEAFQAGKDSVDTQSYYDAGYQAGYDAAYSAGYESGYDVGYQSAMDRIESWGADTSEYPILLVSVDDYSSAIIGSVKTSYPFQYEFSGDWKSTAVYNPFHTYKFVLNFVYDFDTDLSDDVFVLEDDLWTFDIGSLSYNINPGSDVSNVFFIPGDRISTSYSFAWHPILAIYGDAMTSDSVCCGYTVSFDIYDMGPSGDTQNHIANQTDQLTNGYDDSKGNEVNSELSTGLNEYQTAEDSLWATATTGLKDFTFFDFESVPAMITGMSFITSIMGKWFNEAGGTSGVGIVLSILFSVMLVSMVLGLYRLYQSSSRRAEFRQIHKESMERWKKGK